MSQEPCVHSSPSSMGDEWRQHQTLVSPQAAEPGSTPGLLKAGKTLSAFDKLCCKSTNKKHDGDLVHETLTASPEPHPVRTGQPTSRVKHRPHASPNVARTGELLKRLVRLSAEPRTQISCVLRELWQATRTEVGCQLVKFPSYARCSLGPRRFP